MLEHEQPVQDCAVEALIKHLELLVDIYLKSVIHTLQTLNVSFVVFLKSTRLPESF